MRSAVFVSVVASMLVACGSDPAGSGDSGIGGDAGTTSDSGPPLPRDAGTTDSGRTDCGDEVVPAGDVSGVWCGNVQVDGAVTVPSGATLRIEPGAHVLVADGAKITVAGSLTIAGTDAAHVTIGPLAAGWSGIVVSGTMDATFTDVTGASTGLRSTGTTSFTDGTIDAPTRGSTLFAVGGGDTTIDRSTLTHGATNGVTGGVLHMTDTTVDLMGGLADPDCIAWSGGSAVLSHVEVRGCHCSLHINSATTIEVSDSLLVGATNPVMIANTGGAFHGNVIDGASTAMLDIGTGTGVDVDVADNYWGQATADIGSARMSQFLNADMVLDAAPPGAGPR